MTSSFTFKKKSPNLCFLTKVFTLACTYAIRATPSCESPPPYNNYILYVVSFFTCRAASVSIRLGALERALSKFAIPLSKLTNRQVKFAITLLNTLIINQLSASRAKATLCKPSAGALQGEREGGVGKWGSGRRC